MGIGLVASDCLLPVSIVTVTLDCRDFLADMYDAVKAQDYPPELVELIVADGGSTDGTVELAIEQGAQVVTARQFRDNQESRKLVGIRAASNDLVALIDSDNILMGRDWLRRMVRPLIEDATLVGTQTLRYSFRPTDRLLNRYYALAGGADPVACFMRRADRLSWNHVPEKYRWTEEHRDGYMVATFPVSDFPTLGGNGVILRRSMVEKTATVPEAFFHTDVLYDLAKLGFGRYGIVDVGLVHDTGRSFWRSLRKRTTYMRTHFTSRQVERSYQIIDLSKFRHVARLALFSMYAVTLLPAFVQSAIWYRKKRDRAWFLHAPVCLAMMFAYTLSALTSPSIIRECLRALRIGAPG